MNILVAFTLVVALFSSGMFGSQTAFQPVFGIVFPYLAFCLFLGGVIYRVLRWARVPVPFRIPTTCGQQRSLPWIRHDKFENPDGQSGVAGRMALEVLFFRSLLRNSKTRATRGGYPAFRPSLFLWVASLAFHWSMLVVALRHLRLCLEPVPFFVTFLSRGDGVLQAGLPPLLITSVVFPLSVFCLLFRRISNSQVRYFSLLSDYFPLFLLFVIGLSGFCLRYLQRSDVAAVKQLVMGLVTFRPALPASLNGLFYGHLLLVCALVACFPFSKLMHAGGAFLSPTRNLPNNTRRERHVNPWDYPVKVHSYEAYEDEFRQRMKAAGISVEKG